MSDLARAMWRQSVRDLEHARKDAAIGTGLATAAEKAALQDALRALDIAFAFAIARYPGADLDVAPAALVGEKEAREAIAAAGRVLDFARSRGIGGA